MGAVYGACARDGRLGALRLLHPENARRKEIRERFLREAYAANRIAHPGAVRVLEHGATYEDATYLVMVSLDSESRLKRARAILPSPLRAPAAWAEWPRSRFRVPP
jgi:serine/threonine-protein kinase